MIMIQELTKEILRRCNLPFKIIYLEDQNLQYVKIFIVRDGNYQVRGILKCADRVQIDLQYKDREKPTLYYIEYSDPEMFEKLIAMLWKFDHTTYEYVFQVKTPFKPYVKPR